VARLVLIRALETGVSHMESYMKHGLKFLIAAVLVGSALLTACGKKGDGGNNAAPPAQSFGGPAGYIGDGSWSGNVAVPAASLPVYYQMAALTGLCSGYGCQQSHFRIQVTLQSNGGYQQPYQHGQPQPAVAVQTQAAFRLIGANGRFTKQNVYVTGNSSNFKMEAGLYSRPQYGNVAPVPPVAGEPTVAVVGQFKDPSQSVLEIQVLYNNQQVATGQIFCGSNGECGGQIGNPYDQGNPYPGNVNYPGNPYHNGGPYRSGGSIQVGGSVQIGGGYIQAGGFWYPSNRR